MTSCHESGWTLDLTDVASRPDAARDALYALADGCIGTSGAVLAGAGADRWVIAAGVYDGETSDTYLLTAPVAFHLALGVPPNAEFRRVLDLRAGIVHETMTADRGGYQSVRFSSLARPGVVAIRVATGGPLPVGPALMPPVDSHAVDAGVDRDVAWMRVAASTGGIAAAVTEARHLPGEGVASHFAERVAAYHPDPQVLPDPTIAVDRLQAAMSVGFDGLLDEHRREWARRWEDAAVVIEGDDDLQFETRFALFHLMGVAAAGGEAAVAARGLSGAGYHGHVFWDADTFVLPFLAATHPAAARAMLEYRIRRLPVAQAAARAAERAGARFPWESARTGDDVTPTSVKDATGQVVPIRTGELEEHIVAEVAWAACCYVDWTGDEDFASGPGLGLLVETARYWASRVRQEPDGATHIYGVIGPDEYHEPVDDNAFTNVIARWNLRRAAFEVHARGTTDVGETERARWLELADKLVDGYEPATGIYEQFAGFDGLEPLVISEIAQRPVEADALLGIDRVRGAQVVKQADVLLLYHLVPDEMVTGTLEPNLAFYEPRTAHGSSLSPAIHAGLFARAGEFDRALAALRIASRIDLDDLTGTTAGGLHLATMGGLWQALAFGFLGLRPRAGVLHLAPRLPPRWTALELRVRFRGSRLEVRCEQDRLSVRADTPAAISVDDEVFNVSSRGLSFRRRGRRWAVMS